MADAKFTGVKLKWLDRIAADLTISPGAFRLAYVLASDYLKTEASKAYPSHATLARKLGIGERQIRRLIDELIPQYLTSIQGGNGQSNRYSIVTKMSGQASVESDKNVRSADADDGQKCPADRTNLSKSTGQKCPPIPPVIGNPPVNNPPVEGVPDLLGDVSSAVDQVSVAFEAYNEIARSLGLTIARTLDADRRKAIAARLKDSGGIEGWLAALNEIANSQFLCGSKGWKADLDFICQRKSFRGLVEGKYADRQSTRKRTSAKQTLIEREFEQ